jgi:hypothetical protein
MSIFAWDVWMPILSRLNAVLLQSEDFEDDLTAEARSSSWCGSPPASEEEIVEAERRIGLTLPPSYRSFLSVSNCWRPYDNFVERLLPVQEIKPYRDADPKDLAAIQRMDEDDISDSDYVDYDSEEHSGALRPRYYADSILVSQAWGVESERVLLNPSIISIDGEWEVIFSAYWIPGNHRFRSFLEFVKYSVGSLQNIEASKSK